MIWLDFWYIVLVLPMVVFSLIIQVKLNTTFNKYSKIPNGRGMTGAEAAHRVLLDNGINDVEIAQVQGRLSDHYDPRRNTIFLSSEVYMGTSVAAVGVAAHEAGHAVQHAVNYAPMTMRSAIIPMTNIGSMLAFPLILLGLIFQFHALVIVGITLFGTVFVFQLVTLPVEFDASRRALTALSGGSASLAHEEYRGAKKVLSAAAMTYIAALAVTATQLIWLLMSVRGGRRR